MNVLLPTRDVPIQPNEKSYIIPPVFVSGDAKLIVYASRIGSKGGLSVITFVTDAIRLGELPHR